MEEEKNVVENKKIKKSIIVLPIIVIAIIIVAGFISFRIYTDKSYEIEEVTQFSYFKLYENEKYGVIDAKGNILVEPKYDMLTIPNPSKAVFIGYFNYNSEKGEYQTEVLNDKNEKILTEYEQVLPLMFKDASSEVPYEKSVLCYRENGKYGIINFQGKKITKAIYDSIESLLYKEGCLLVKQDDKYGIINIKGKEIIEVSYDSISADGYYDEETKYEKAGFIVGKRQEAGYRYSYFNNNGKMILEVEYNEIDRVTEITEENEVYLLAFRNGQAGVYKEKNQIIKHLYEEIEYNKKNELFIVQKNNKQGVITKEGNKIIDTKYDYIMILDETILAEKEDSTETFDMQGNKQELQNNITKHSVENTNYFITTNSEDLSGIVDTNGKTILENKYSYIEYAFSDFFIVTKDGKVGVVNAKSNEEVISNYNVIQKIENSNAIQAIISNPYTIEIYNEKMEKVASMKDANLKVEKNYLELSSKTERKYFDSNGNEIQNTDIFFNLELFAFVNEEGKWGFKNKDGAIVIEPNYDMVTELNTYGFAGIRKDDKWGVINSNGEIIVEPTYEIEWDNPEFIGPYVKLNFGYGMIYYTKELEQE